MPRGRDPSSLPPILADKDHAAPSVFEPANLLREARRQKNVPAGRRAGNLRARSGRRHRARAAPRRTGAGVAGWACYHTESFEFEHAGRGSASSAARSAPPSPC